MEFVLIPNWTGPGKILHTKQPVRLKLGDNYIGIGLSGENIFTYSDSDVDRLERKVVAISSDLIWGKTGNQTLSKLPVIDL